MTSESPLTRADFLKRSAAAAAVAAPALLAPAGALGKLAGARLTRATASKTVTWLTYALYSDPTLTAAFTKQTGISISPDNFGELPQMETKLRAGGNDDVVSISSNLVTPLAQEGLLQPVDPSRIPNWKNLYKQFADADFVRYNGEIYGVPTVWGPEGLIYRTDKLKNVDSWDILWDEKYKGQLAMINYDYEDFLTGALYLGITKPLKENPISFTAAELTKIKAALTQQIHLDVKTWTDTAVAESLLASGEAIASVGRIAFLTDLQKQHIPVKLINPKEGTQGWVTSTCIVKTTSNIDGCYDFLNYVISPDYGVPLAHTYGYPATSTRVMSAIPPTLRKEMFLNDPALLEKMYFWKPTPQQSQITQDWTEVLAAA
jgi:spermidine/putrescine-binding protein